MNRFALIFSVVCAYVLVGCRSFYHDEGMSIQKTFLGKGNHFIYTYYYPDSVLRMKEHIYERYDKEQGTYVEYKRRTKHFDRSTPYIAIIDTVEITSPEMIVDTYRGDLFRNERLHFSDSSTFVLRWDGPGGSTTQPTYTLKGKYHLENGVLKLFHQQYGDLVMDTTLFEVYQDSLVKVSTNKWYNEVYRKNAIPR